MAHNDYIERLTEAQLEGRPLPEPTTPEEEVQRQQFHETESIFEEIHTMRLGNDWMRDVWSRIDGESAATTARAPSAAPLATGETASVEPAASDASPRPAVDEAHESGEDDEDASPGGKVIDASSRFRLWPALSGLAVAAMALLVVGVFLTSGADDKEASQSEASAGADSAAEADYRTMASAEAPEASEGVELEEAPPRAGARSTMGGTSSRERPGQQPPEEVAAAEPMGDAAATERPAALPADETSADPGSLRANLDTGLTGGVHDDMDAEAGEGFAMGGGGVGSANAPRRTSRSDKKKAGGWAGEEEKSDALEKSGDWGGVDSTTTSTGRGRGWNQPKPQRVRLTAGEVDDNTNFADFQQFLSERSKSHLEPIDVSERMFVRVLDQNNRPIPNATVDFRVGNTTVFSATTYSDGWALFHPRSVGQAAQAEGFDLRIRAGQAEHDYRIQRGTKEEWQVRLPIERTVGARQTLDLVFLLDTTQSMQDQIDTLQDTIKDVVAEVGALPGQPEVRLGLVVFRDDNEEYVSRVFDFQTDVGAFQRLLSEQEAAGGGDLPERVEVGLHRAVHELSWGADSTRMVFLVGDAGPHKRSLNEFSYAQDAQAAASQAIKIFPVATSGLDDDGEYVFRQLAQYTMGRFIFLTTGAGATSTPHDVKPGSFQPETLDRLVVRLVREELTAMELDPGELRETQGQQR